MKDRINLSKEEKQNMILSIKEYFYNERDEEIGDLAATLILDFFIKELAPAIYNKGIQDCYKFLNDKLGDMIGLEI